MHYQINLIRYIDTQARPIYLNLLILEETWRQGGLEGVANAQTRILRMPIHVGLHLVLELPPLLDLPPSLWAQKPTEVLHAHRATII